MNISRILAWLRGQYLSVYEKSRIAWRGDEQNIIVPPNADEFADVSFYQSRMDWNRYPHKAAIIRLGQNVWKDSEFEYNYAELKRLKKLTGGYWFWDDRQSPETQANIIINMMAGKSLELELFIDVERTYSGAYGGASTPGNVRKMMTMIEAKGLKAGIYTGYYYWRDNVLPYCTADDKAYFGSRPLWIAWYAGASVVKIPEPWTDWLYWQYGTPSIDWGQPTAEIDANKKNGTFSTSLPSDEVITKPYDGVTTIKGKRSGWDYTIDIIDPRKVTIEMARGNPLAQPSYVAVQKGASLAYNGGEWDKVSRPIDLSIQDYFIYVAREDGAFRPSLLIMGDGSPIVDIVNRANVKHALTGLRYLIWDSEIQSYLYRTDEAQYTEGHARTCYGIDTAGYVMVFTCNGLYPNQGLKLFEVAELMWQHGAVDAFDAGGGGDTVRVKDGKVTNVPQDGLVRAVPETFLVYANEVQMARYSAKAIDSTRIRPDHNTNNTAVATVPAGTILTGDVLFVATENLYNTSGVKYQSIGDQWLQISEGIYTGKWIAIIHMGTPICTLTDNQPAPVDDEIEILVNGELKYHIIGKLQ